MIRTYREKAREDGNLHEGRVWGGGMWERISTFKAGRKKLSDFLNRHISATNVHSAWGLNERKKTHLKNNRFWHR